MQATVDEEKQTSHDYQKIEFQGNDSHTVEITSDDVIIIPSAGDHSTGSSKVKLQNVVDYTWEERFYTGQLLAVHMAGKYLAYGVKAGTKTTGVVRVLNRETSNRALIKGMDAMVQDISFAYIPQEVLLGCVDQIGNLFVHEVHEDKSGITCTLLLHVISDKDFPPIPCHRVVWCPYIPENGSKGTVTVYDDIAGLLALTRGTKVELWNVPMVKNLHGVGPVKPGAVDDGYLEVNEHSQLIVDAAFSPDGTAIATASFDGEVKFFQVYMQNGGKPRCLHQWKPHNGRPLSSLFFLDNHKNYNPEAQFWKFAMTGANENSELKLWSCESWTCLQTIRFMPRIDGSKMQLKASMDLGSGYLLLTDHVHRVLFVLQVQKDETETNCFFQAVSEFPLPYPILSFGIVDAGLKRFKSDRFTLDDLCNGEGDEDEQLVQTAIVIRMYLMQPKSLQECHIVYQTSVNNLPEDLSSNSHSVSQNSIGYHDQPLPDIPLPETVPVPPVSAVGSLIEPLASHSSLQLNLMTPDAFNSPVKHESPASSSVMSLGADPTVILGDNVYRVSPTDVSESQSPIPDSARAEGVVGFASGGSSPSREVQKIFSLQGKCYFPESDKPLQQQAVEDIEIQDIKQEVETEWPLTPPIPPAILSNEPRNIEEEEINRDNQINKVALEFVEFKDSVRTSLDVIQSMLEKQNEEIQTLKEDIKRHNNIREVEKLIKRQIQQQTSFIENTLLDKDNDKNQEALLSAISQTVNNLIATKLEYIVTSEINSVILPAVGESMESLKQELHVEMTQKLSATDHLLKENISKLVNSKSVMDVLSNTLVNAIKPCLAEACKESFMSTALPSYEKASAAMFTQINETFSKGTKEYISAFEGLSRKLNDKTRDTSELIQTSVDLIRSTAQQMTLEINRAFSSIESRVGDALRAQQTALEGSVLAAVRSITPAPDSREANETQIYNLLQSGHYNAAFQQALSASDLSLVIYACENTQLNQLFGQHQCPLHQHVLLSLIQQLSADMNSYTELKHKFLEEAVMTLDVENPTTREHMPNVLNNLKVQLQKFITSNPNHKLARSMKVLIMASQSLLAA